MSDSARLTGVYRALGALDYQDALNKIKSKDTLIIELTAVVKDLKEVLLAIDKEDEDMEVINEVLSRAVSPSKVLNEVRETDRKQKALIEFYESRVREWSEKEIVKTHKELRAFYENQGSSGYPTGPCDCTVCKAAALAPSPTKDARDERKS